jgi:hypothetical protein
LGYLTDSYALLPAGTVCSAGLTVPAGVTGQFSGSNFVRAKLHISLTAQAGTWTTTGLVAVLLQSSPDGGTTWYPDAAATIAAAGYASNTAITGYQALFTAGTTPVTGKYSTTFTGFPGSLFRAAVYVVTGTSVTLGITGDFQKFVADAS